MIIHARCTGAPALYFSGRYVQNKLVTFYNEMRGGVERERGREGTERSTKRRERRTETGGGEEKKVEREQQQQQQQPLEHWLFFYLASGGSAE